MLCVGAASILAESAAMGLAPINGQSKTTKSNSSHVAVETNNLQVVNLGARPKRSSLRNWPPPPKIERENSEVSDVTPPQESDDYSHRRDSVLEDYETMPLAFLTGLPDGGSSRLALARVDELAEKGQTEDKVRRAKSLPMSVQRRPGNNNKNKRTTSASARQSNNNKRRSQHRVRLSRRVKVMPSYVYFGSSSQDSQDSPLHVVGEGENMTGKISDVTGSGNVHTGV